MKIGCVMRGVMRAILLLRYHDDIFQERQTLSHSEYCHGDQPQHVGEHELLVDGEMKPGVVGEQVVGGHVVPFRGEE